MDDLETMAEALRIDTPVREVGVVVGYQAGDVTCIRVGAKSAEGRHDPIDTEKA